MDLEFHQLDLRYDALRTRHPRKERQLLASLADHGQLLPVVVVAADVPFVLVDGYKRVRALQRLAHDTVRATVWAIDEAEAVVLEHVMRDRRSGRAVGAGLAARGAAGALRALAARNWAAASTRRRAGCRDASRWCGSCPTRSRTRCGPAASRRTRR